MTEPVLNIATRVPGESVSQIQYTQAPIVSNLGYYTPPAPAAPAAPVAPINAGAIQSAPAAQNVVLPQQQQQPVWATPSGFLAGPFWATPSGFLAGPYGTHPGAQFSLTLPQMGTDIFGEAPPPQAAATVETPPVPGVAVQPAAALNVAAPVESVDAYVFTPTPSERQSIAAWNQTLALERLDQARAPLPAAAPAAPAEEAPAAPTALDRIGALNLKGVAADAISPGTDAEAELATVRNSLREHSLIPRPADPADGLAYDSQRTAFKKEEDRLLGVVRGRRSFETAVNSGLQTYPELLDALPADQELTVVGLTDAVRAALQERFEPLMAIPGLSMAAQEALSVFDVSAGSAIKEPSGVGSLFNGYGAALTAGAAAIETHLADELGVPRTPSGPGGIFSESDLARIERGIDYVKEHGLAEAFPTVLASLEGRKTRAEDAISVANGTADDATKLLSEYDVGLRASVSKWAHGDEALEVAEAQLTPLRSNFKLQVEAIKASGKTPAQQKAAIAEAATQYNSAARAVLSQIGRSERPSNNPFRRSTYAADSWNWEGIMTAGGLALALYGPFERRESERRARRYAEKQDDKQWERLKEQMALQNDYRLQQIGAAGEASRGGGSVAAVRPARF